MFKYPLYSDGFFIHINAIGWNSPFHILRARRSELPNYNAFLFLKIVLTSTKSVDPGEMPLSAAFLMGLHCLPKYPFRVFQNTKG